MHAIASMVMTAIWSIHWLNIPRFCIPNQWHPGAKHTIWLYLTLAQRAQR